MVTQRKISIPIYATAFIISLIIFVSGIFVGRLITTSGLEDLSQDVSDVSQRVASVQILLLMEGNSSAFCPVYSSELDSIDENVEVMGYKLSYLENEQQVSDPELKKQYFVLQAESYLLSKKINQVCGDDAVLLINFYSNEDCDDCVQQGAEVLQARDESDRKVKLYSFDGGIGSPIADAFKKQYKISRYPSLVINEKTYPGYRTSDQIKAIIEEAQ